LTVGTKKHLKVLRGKKVIFIGCLLPYSGTITALKTRQICMLALGVIRFLPIRDKCLAITQGVVGKLARYMHNLDAVVNSLQSVRAKLSRG
jgi:hypothetical protein